MLFRGLISVVSASALLLLGACASTGESVPRATIDAAPIARAVVLCKSTLTELQSQLGEPTRDGILHRKRVVSWITAWDPLTRYLAVVVRRDGVIVDLYWDIPTEVPWRPKNLCRKD